MEVFIMRKNKLLAVLLAALVALAGMAAPAAAEAVEFGVINGNLDSVNESNRPSELTVEKTGATSEVWSSDTYRRGDVGYAALMRCVDAADTTMLNATMTGLEEGKLYTASLWFYVAEAPETGTGNLKLWSYAENRKDGEVSPSLVNLEIKPDYNDGRWYPLSHTFTVNNIDSGKLRIDVLGAGYSVYIDDITVREETNLLLSSGKTSSQTVSIKDMDFELGKEITGFQVTEANVTASLVSDATCGNYGMKIIKKAEGNNGVYTTLDHYVFEKGAKYKLSYSIKRAESGAEATAAFRFIWNLESGSDNTWFSAVAGDEWERQTQYFQAPDAFFDANKGTNFYINLHGNYANCAVGNGVILDDLRLEKVRNENGFVNAAGFTVAEAAPGETVTAEITRVPAVAGTAESALCAVATYKRNEDGSVIVTDVKLEKVEITAGDSYVIKEISVIMPTPEDTETYTIKSFVWDGALMPADALCTVKLATE